MPTKRTRSVSPGDATLICKSSPISDRASKFVALYSPSLSAKQLQGRGELETAMHRMAAWRKPNSQRALSSQRVFDTGYDDDGENYGGKTLASVMAEMDVEGTVVVARWYGGILLGPVRFDHIRVCAREAISKWSQERDIANKKRKVHEDAETKDRLIRTLAERDQSIRVLRGLLAEKSQPVSYNATVDNTPAKVPNYMTLPLPTLEKLEQVRDATIGWILKEIEKVESSQKNDEAKADTTSAATALPSTAGSIAFKANDEVKAVGGPGQDLDSPVFRDEKIPNKPSESHSVPD